MVQRHEMVLGPVSGGAQEWACAVCGRRVVLRLPYERVVLDRGDESAVHSGSAGAVAVTGADLTQDPPDTDWLRRAGIAWPS